ncbi:MAG: DUF4910 domain-containing protein [Sulfurimonas sp.]|nr:DUF4910 domain-containing protein [Sulfurimonas sp.]
MNKTMMDLLNDLYPLHRTLNHDDNLVALNLIEEYIDNEKFSINKYEAGSHVWTWNIPRRFHVNHAYLKNVDGNVIINFEDNPLHIVSYSKSINKKISFDELEEHLYYSDKNPDSIPWQYKYYDNRWGLCLSKNVFDSLDKKVDYIVDISTELLDKPMVAGEFFIQGESNKEILIVTNICHPYQVNDSITGLVVAARLAKELEDTKLFHSIRFLFVPETVGTVAWFANNEEKISNIKYGFSFDCLGNNNTLTLQKTMYEDSHLDFLVEHKVQEYESEILIKKFIEEMSNDELVMSSPGIEIPTVAFHRAPYKEYHTSADNPSIINSEVLEESYNFIKDVISTLAKDYIPKQKSIGLIFMSKFNLHPDEDEDLEALLKIKAINQYINGRHTAYELSKIIDLDLDKVLNFLQIYLDNNLIIKVDR